MGDGIGVYFFDNGAEGGGKTVNLDFVRFAAPVEGNAGSKEKNKKNKEQDSRNLL